MTDAESGRQAYTDLPLCTPQSIPGQRLSVPLSKRKFCELSLEVLLMGQRLQSALGYERETTRHHRQPHPGTRSRNQQFPGR